MIKDTWVLLHQSQPQQTIFAPVWEYTMFEANAIDDLDVDHIAKVVVANEKDIIAKYEYVHDWNTGLGPDSVTSRSRSYNLLTFPELKCLSGVIRQAHDKYLSSLGAPSEDEIYVQCWCNVLRKGQHIGKHFHSSSPFTYLGGHITIKTEGTNTNYINPITKDVYASENIPGKLTLFPNWIEHYTDVYNGDTERISIAFDIIPKHVFDVDIFEDKKDHWVKL